MFEFNFTVVIIIVTVLTSISAFKNRELFDKLKFNAWMINNRNNWFRFISHGFIHVDPVHLAINMFVLYSFGGITENSYMALFGNSGRLIYLALYLVAIVVSSIFSYLKHRNNEFYNAVGASGAVSAVVFASIIFAPKGGIGLLFVPGISIPAPVFGVLYLIYSAYMAKRGKDNIGHDAHFWGAVFGVAFTFAVKPQLYNYFISQLF